MRYLFFIFISYIYLQANAHIFVYHRFGDSKHSSTNTSIKELKKEFEYFKQNNYKVVPLQQIIDKVYKKEDIPDNWVALTIDDTYKSFYQNGLKIFKQYNYPFNLNVYVEATDKNYKDFMSWEEIKEASKYGEIGLHSYAHPHLTKISIKEALEDTKKAYDIFKKELGYAPKTYVYPYGEYNEEIKNSFKKFNFRTILNQSTGTVTSKSDPQDIFRLALVGDVNIKHKLRYKTFDTTWIEPKVYPKDKILKRVKAKVNPKFKKLKLYITGFGWRDITVKNGIVDIKLNLKLKRSRTRLMLGPNVFTISNKLILK